MILLFSISLQYNTIMYPFQSSQEPVTYDIYDYFFPSMKDQKNNKNNIGEIISGITSQPSPFVFHYNGSLEDVCVELSTEDYSISQKEQILYFIRKQYFGSLFLNNIRLRNPNFAPGFLIGYQSKQNNNNYLYNHFKFKIYIRQNSKNSSLYDVVDFILDSQKSNERFYCNAPRAHPICIETQSRFLFSYSYSFVLLDSNQSSSLKSTQQLESLRIPFTNNSFSVKLIISILPASIFLLLLIVYFTRVRSSIRSVADLSLDDIDPLEEEGWKLVHGDVFRRPVHDIKLCGIFGTGIQLFLSLLCCCLLTFKMNYSLSQLLTSFIQFFTFFYCLNGFFSSKLYKTIGQSSWRSNLLFAYILPIFIFFFCYIISGCFYFIKKSNAAPTVSSFLMLFKYSFLGFIFHIVGSLIALKSPPFSVSQRINQLARQIPPQSSIIHLFALLLGFISSLGLYPASQIFMKVFWKNAIFYEKDQTIIIIGLFSTIIAISCAGIINTQSLLNKENYKWWWGTIRVGLCPGIFFFLLAILFFLLDYNTTGFSNMCIYFTQSLLITMIICLISASSSLAWSFCYVNIIFSSLKME